MSVPTNICLMTEDTITSRTINGRVTMRSPAWPGKIIRSSTKFRGRNSSANGNIRAIMPTLRPTAKRITSANAAGVRTRSFVRTARYSIRRDWSARGGTPWIAPARKVSTPLTRRLQKQWRKLIGESEYKSYPGVNATLTRIRMRIRRVDDENGTNTSLQFVLIKIWVSLGNFLLKHLRVLGFLLPSRTTKLVTLILIRRNRFTKSMPNLTSMRLCSINQRLPTYLRDLQLIEHLYIHTIHNILNTLCKHY